MYVKITTLSENTAGFGFLAEWGLSLFIDINGFKVLMDTGMGNSAVINAKMLDVDFRQVDAIVLSHGHIDHTGGLAEVLKLSGPKRIIAHPDVFAAKYSDRRRRPDRNIGIPFCREELEKLGASFELSREPVEIAPGIVSSGEVPMETDYEQLDEGLFWDSGQGVEPDPLADDLSLAIKTSEGLIVVLGCAHRGPVNIIRHLQNISGEQGIHAVVGGTHLVHASDERIYHTIDDFKRFNVSKVACSHCTGMRAGGMMADAFGDSFIYNNAGTRLTFTF